MAVLMTKLFMPTYARKTAKTKHKNELKLLNILYLCAFFMTQNPSIADQNKEIPLVGILPVGKPVPLPSTDALVGERLQDSSTEGQKTSNPQDSTTGDKK
jgi:hypothetical protein